MLGNYSIKKMKCQQEKGGSKHPLLLLFTIFYDKI